MFQDALHRFLDGMRAGRVRTAFAENVALLRGELIDQLASRQEARSVVSITWTEAPELEVELDAVVHAMAEAALSVWPNWYSTPTARFEGRDQVPRGLVSALASAQGQGLPVSESWAKRVWSRCERGKLPTSGKVANAEQVRQLALAIDLQRPLLVVAVLEANVRSERLQVLSKALEWMAAQAESPVILLAPGAWNGRPELDGISFEAWDADTPREVTTDETSAGPTSVRHATPAESDVGPASIEPLAQPTPPLTVVVEPLYGKPHPNSRVECYLAKCLAADEELRSLFHWNYPMPALGPGCTVDLLWEAGRLVIEIDGPDHLAPHKYNGDRRRDYTLLLRGYTTLRITNDAINHDVALVLEQIRNVVRHLHAHKPAKTHGTDPQTSLGALAHAHG